MQFTGQEIDAKAFWQTLGNRAGAAIVVTAAGADGPVGFLGLSFAHVSADPPVALVSVSRTTAALEGIAGAGHFAANALPAGAHDLAVAFGGKATGDRFEAGLWESFVTGAPVLKRAKAVFDCEVIRTVETDGAVTFFGRVVGLRAEPGSGATIFYGKGFRDLEP